MERQIMSIEEREARIAVLEGILSNRESSPHTFDEDSFFRTMEVNCGLPKWGYAQGDLAEYLGKDEGVLRKLKLCRFVPRFSMPALDDHSPKFLDVACMNEWIDLRGYKPLPALGPVNVQGFVPASFTVFDSREASGERYNAKLYNAQSYARFADLLLLLKSPEETDVCIVHRGEIDSDDVGIKVFADCFTDGGRK